MLFLKYFILIRRNLPRKLISQESQHKVQGLRSKCLTEHFRNSEVSKLEESKNTSQKLVENKFKIITINHKYISY